MNRGEILYPHDEGRLAQGMTYLLLGQAFFVLSLYLLHATLARAFTPAEYGLFSVVMTILTWVEITVNTGIPSTLEKFLPEDTSMASAMEGWALKLQGLGAGLIFLLFLTLAPLIAALLQDKRLGFYLRLAALDIPILAFYALFRGMLNGFQAFGQQAIIVVVYSLARVGGILLLVLLGFALAGAFVGNALASLVALMLAFFFSRRLKGREAGVMNLESVPSLSGVKRGISGSRLFRFALPVILFTLCSNLLINIDLYSVKALIADETIVGFYAAAVNLANAPRFVFLAFSFVLLPSLSESIAIQDWERVRRRLGQVGRFLILFLLPGALIVAATSKELVTLVYSASYSPAAPTLNILIFSAAFYSIYIVLVTVMLAENRPLLAFGLGISLLPVALVANWRLISLWGVMGAALASALTTFLGLLLSGIYAIRRFGMPLPLKSLLKIVLASVVVYLLAGRYSVSGVLVFLNYAFLFSVYIFLLYLVREISLEDWQTIRSLVPLPGMRF